MEAIAAVLKTHDIQSSLPHRRLTEAGDGEQIAGIHPVIARRKDADELHLPGVRGTLTADP